MAVAIPSVVMSFCFRARVEGRLNFVGIDEEPGLLGPELAAVGILDSPEAFAAVLVFRGGITIFSFLLFKLCSLKLSIV